MKSGLVIELISTANCKLCADALIELNNLQRKHGFLLIERKAKPGTGEYERYKNEFPVLIIGGEKRLSGRLEPGTMETLIHEA